MKRVLSVICTVALLLSCLIIPASAGDFSVWYGTPVVDGQLDEDYLSSCNMYLGLNPAYIKINPANGGENIPAITKGDCYILWDNSYMYFYCTAYDSDIQSGDLVSLFFFYEGVAWCISYDPYAEQIVNPEQSAAYNYFDSTKTKSAFSVNEEEGYYTVELALRMYNLSSIDSMGFHYCVTNQVGEARNQSTSGVFFDDFLRFLSNDDMLVRRGTPTVDGYGDELYYSSDNFYIGRDLNYIKVNPENGGENIPAIERGDCYILWDSDYLYFYCTVYDDDIQPNDEVTLFFYEDEVAWCITYDPYTKTLEPPEQELAYNYVDPTASWAVFSQNTDDGYYAVEFALNFTNLYTNRIIGFHYCVVNSEGSASNMSLSGNFFSDSFVLDAKTAEGETGALQIRPNSPIFEMNGYVYGLPVGATVSDLCNYYIGGISVYGADQTQLGNTDCVGNGATVCRPGASEGQTLIITGDINGNGGIDSNDYLLARSIFLMRDGAEKYAEGSIGFLAADVNGNGIVESNDYILIRQYTLGLRYYLIPEAPVAEYEPTTVSQQQWCGEVKTNTLNHVLAAMSTESEAYFGSCRDTTFGNFYMNAFGAGMYTGGERLNVSDPLYLQMFINTLYDYTYPVIFISVPKSDSETREAYLSALKAMLDAAAQYQPTSEVIFVNVFGSDIVYTNVANLFEKNGAQYWDYSSQSVSEFQSRAYTFLDELELKERPSKPEGAASDEDLLNIREGMYWIIYDVEDPCQTVQRDRVLLIGDSISFGYYNAVRENLKEEYYVDEYGISLAPSDTANILRGLKVLLDTYHYEAIHINIGLHGGVYDLADNQYAVYLREILTSIQEMAPQTKIIFATTTPITNSTVSNDFAEDTYTWIKDRNDMANAVCEELGITINDLYTMVLIFAPPKADTHHYSDQTLLSSWVANAIRTALQ